MFSTNKVTQFTLVKQKLNLPRTYTPVGSRRWIVENNNDAFLAETEAIKAMSYMFLQLADNVGQYFLEYLAEEEFELGHEGLDTS